MRNRVFFLANLCLVFFGNAILTEVMAMDATLEDRLLQVDGATVFHLDFANNYTAVTRKNVIEPGGNGNIKLPEIKSEGAINFVRLSSGQVLSYPAINNFPTEKGTFEILIRYRNSGNKTLGRQHVFTLYQSDLERIYLRFYDMKLHYLVRNGTPITDGKINHSANIDQSSWSHVAMQWDFTDEQNGWVQVYLNGQKVCERDRLKIAPIELTEKSDIFIGSWINGDWPMMDFDISAVRISDVNRYSGKTVREIQYEIKSQKFELTKKKIEQLISDEELGVTVSECKSLVQMAEKTEFFWREYSNATDSGSISEAFVAIDSISSRVEQIENTIKSRRWNKLNKGKGLLGDSEEFVVFSESPMLKIREDKVRYCPSSQKQIELFAAGNEFEPFQLIFASLTNDDTKIKIRVSDLVMDDGDNIVAADNIELLRVRSLGEEFPDPLFSVGESETISPSEIGVFWVNVYVPKGSKSGQYHGIIEVIADTGRVLQIPYSLNVWDFSLPVKPALKTAFGYSPEFVEAWTPGMVDKDINKLSDAYIKYMLKHRTTPKSYLRFKLEMSDEVKTQARKLGGEIDDSQNCALKSNVGLFHPRQILKKDGSIILDFAEFDKMVEKYLPYGLNSFVAGNRFWDAQNHSRSVLAEGKDVKKLKHKLWVYDEQLGKERTLYLDVLSDDYKETMQSIFRQWQEHLEQKGWLDMGYGYLIDEPETYMFELASQLYGIAGQASPEIPLLITNAPEKKIDNIDIWCPMFHKCPVPLIEETLASSKEMWYYVCISPDQPYGNFFLCQDSIDHRILFWQTYKYGGKGFLYWEINFWAAGNPLAGMAGGSFSNTLDGSLVYPGPNGPIGSLRYEMIREGIEDYDYLVLLREALSSGKLSESDKIKAEKLLEVPSELVVSPKEFTHDPEVLYNFRKSIGEILNQN